MKDIQQHAYDRISEILDFKGFQDADDVLNAIENLEDNFDAESYCPYYSQQDEVIRDYEDEFWRDAEEITGGKTYTATQWQEAKTDYAYAIAYLAFSHYFAIAKDELKEAIEEFIADVDREFSPDEEIRIQVNNSCLHGWAAHDRELSDGTMIFESRQLDGCNGMERDINGVWVSCCFEPNTKPDEVTP